MQKQKTAAPQESSQPTAVVHSGEQPVSARPWRSQPHLTAILIVLMLLMAAPFLVGAWADRYVAAVSPNGFDEVVKDTRMLKLALNRQDTRVLFGSSELIIQDDFKASKVFETRPTGYSVFVVAGGNRQSIHNLMSLAAAGTDLRDRQVAMFVSHTWFKPTITPEAYKKNFSLLQAYELTFSSSLSDELGRRAAARIIELGSPATDDSILDAALHARRDGDTLRYHALWPIGQATIIILRMQADVDLVRLIWSKGLEPDRDHGEPQAMDWDKMAMHAKDAAETGATNNPFGIRNDVFTRLYASNIEAYRGSDQNSSLLDSTEHADLALEMDVLQELKAKPVFVVLPAMGRWEDFVMHPVADRRAYYKQVRSMIESKGFPVIDLSSYEYEPGFMRDPWHPGWKGNVRINQALDRYFRESTLEDGGVAGNLQQAP